MCHFRIMFELPESRSCGSLKRKFDKNKFLFSRVWVWKENTQEVIYCTEELFRHLFPVFSLTIPSIVNLKQFCHFWAIYQSSYWVEDFLLFYIEHAWNIIVSLIKKSVIYISIACSWFREKILTTYSLIAILLVRRKLNLCEMVRLNIHILVFSFDYNV